MTRFGLRQTLLLAIGAIVLVALATGAVVYLTLDDLREAAAARTVARKVSASLDDYLVAMLDQETGIRGYLLTGAEANLEPYTRGLAAQTATVATLETALAGEPPLLKLLRDAEESASTWQQAIAIRAQKEFGEPAKRAKVLDLERSEKGKKLFDAFRERLALVQAEEDRRVARYDAAFHNADRLMGVVTIVSPLFVLAFCLGIALALSNFVFRPLLQLVATMRRIADKDLAVDIPKIGSRTEVGEMARAVQAFKDGQIEVERTSVLRALADTVPALIGYIDARREVRFLNSAFAQWFTLPSQDVRAVINLPVASVFPDGALPGNPDQLNSALNGFQARVDHRFAKPDGTVRDVEVIYQPHVGTDGEIYGAVTLITDVTQRKEFDRKLAVQARELKRSNEELEQFAYVASHDLKAPLRGIENLITWIEEDIAEHLQGETRSNMNLLHNRVRRLESLLNDLLEYSRAGRRAHTDETIDSKALVNELAVLISPPVGFSIAADDGLPTLDAPRAPLTQVFQNLMSNAIKHHDDPAHGTIRVTSRPHKEGVEFVVTDNGPGIPVRFHDRVFGMFQTLRPRDEVEGSGMGLAIVKKLVEAQGGAVSLEAREGRGLAVHFVWPTQKREERTWT